MTMEANVGEFEIQQAILELMKDRCVWSNADLKHALRNALPWTEDDRKASKTRPNEFVWENRVNNALSPSRKSSLYGKNQVENTGHGLHKISVSGYSFITDNWSVQDILKGLIDGRKP
jgi:hypothetical protein